MSDDFIALLTPPPATFPQVSVAGMEKYDPAKPNEYDYYSDTSLYYAVDISVPDFLITSDTKEFCGIIYRFELKDVELLKWVTWKLDKKTYCITMPGSSLLESKTRQYNPLPNLIDMPMDRFGAFEIIWSKQEDLMVYGFSDFFGLYWLFKIKEENCIFSGIKISEHIIGCNGLILPSKDKLLY